MTTDEFESVVSDYYGDHVIAYEYEGEVSGVVFSDGITAEVRRDDIDRTAREAIFFLCDMWAGMSAKHPVSDAWIKEAITCAREVQIGKLMIDGSWDDGGDT